MLIQKRRLYLISAIASLVIGSILLFLSKANLTGAVIGVPDSAGSLFGTILILASAIMFLMVHYEREKHDTNINSFRRWLEKKKHRSLDYDHAKQEYEILEKNYWKAISDRIIKKAYEDRPLKFIEDYISTPENKRLYSEKAEVSNEAKEILESGRIVTKARELKSIAERMGYEIKIGKGHDEVYSISSGKHVLVTDIPRHELGKGLSRKILKNLRYGHR